MAETTFTFDVDEELKSAFEIVAALNGVSAGEMLRDAMRQAVEEDDEPDPEYEAWFRAEVEQGLKELDDPSVELIPHEVVRAEWDVRRAELLKLIQDKPA